MKVSVINALYSQFTKVPPVETADLTGRSVLVVGANTGIGLEAAKHFARMNPGRLILGCRNQAKGTAAVTCIEKDTGFKGTELWSIDLSSFSNIIEFAEKFERDGVRLDILVMNAAILTLNYEATADGYESTLQVNHLGTSLLSLLLLPSLLRTANEASTVSRLVIVSSDSHYFADITKEEQASPNILAKLNSKEYCTTSVMQQRYSVTKLLNIFFTRALNARILSSAPLIVDTPNPGFCDSELRRELPFPLSTINRVAERMLAFTTEEGSRQLVYAAVGGNEEPSKMRGAYINLGNVQEVSDFVLSAEGGAAQERIWTETIDCLAEVTPLVRKIVDRYLSAVA
ncbi:short-chain dehydrogenase [Athelia psychrophila]|uniref:Short-chain dehydrogenase n=1 Tax=Athelia psychrophila TaxID=1759441 RepID=A0A166GMT1_9AGAM|nr:short-chain dehydrogenase [Fibularhizoctonia sp. CBS 109695]